MTLTIRRATREDAALVTAIEAACFPPAEAAGIDRMTPRLARFADHFWIAEEDGLPVGMINGMVIDQKVIDDVSREYAPKIFSDFWNDASVLSPPCDTSASACARIRPASSAPETDRAPG